MWLFGQLEDFASKALNLILLLENDFRFITPEKSFSDLKNVSSICCWFFVVKKVKTILVSVTIRGVTIMSSHSNYSSSSVLKLFNILSDNFILTSLGRGKNVPPPIFKIALKNYFTSSLGYFCNISDTDFFQNHEFFCFFVQKIYFFIDKFIKTSCLPSYKLLWSNG